ncbi:MAG: putative metal-binding motif-containing protein [Deltaproteobacteria bacterium]|nr:putative metal-binding motif-containing protein [Deltaproteobacteria bacterium]
MLLDQDRRSRNLGSVCVDEVTPASGDDCDTFDNDCNGGTTATDSSTKADGVAVCDGDCDDQDPFRAPGFLERCDYADNDCDAGINEAAATSSTTTATGGSTKTSAKTLTASRHARATATTDSQP